MLEGDAEKKTERIITPEIGDISLLKCPSRQRDLFASGAARKSSDGIRNYFNGKVQSERTSASRSPGRPKIPKEGAPIVTDVTGATDFP